MAGESAVARVERFLLLLPWLKNHPGVTITEAAEHFGITTAQLVQDLRDICDSEVPGMYPGDGVNITYWGSDLEVRDDCTIVVTESLNFDRPTRIGAADAGRLVLALEVLETMVGSGFSAIRSARDKLTALAPGVVEDAETVPTPARAPSAVIATVMQALATGQCLTIDYLSGGRDEISTRVIEPMELVVEAGGLERVESWCRRAEGVRSFRVDRILRAELSDEAPRRPEAIDRAAALGDSPAMQVHVSGPSTSAWALDGLPGCARASAPGEPIAATFAAGSMEWAVRWALSHADVLTVTAPADLVAQIRARAREALQA